VRAPPAARRLTTGPIAPGAMTAVLAALAAVGGALAHVHPAANPVLDRLYPAALAAGVVIACARSPRWTWLILGGAALAFSRGGALAPGGLALAVAFAATLAARRQPLWGAVVGAPGRAERAAGGLRWVSTACPASWPRRRWPRA